MLNLSDAIKMIKEIEDTIKKSAQYAVNIAAKHLEDAIRRNIDSQKYLSMSPDVPHDTAGFGGLGGVVEPRPIWLPLKKETVKKRGSSGPILKDKGDLYDSIKSVDVSGDGDVMVKVGVFGDMVTIALSMEMGTYWGNIKFGTDGEHVNIPPRSFLLNTINDETANIQRIIKDELRDYLGAM